MDLDAIRTQLMAEHKELRRLIAAARRLAAKVKRKEAKPQQVREALDALHKALQEHQVSEEAQLTPLLQDIDAWGPQRVEIMNRAHLAEHKALGEALEQARVARGKKVVEVTEAVTRVLLEHMEEEEEYFLSADVLSWNLVRVDFTG